MTRIDRARGVLLLVVVVAALAAATASTAPPASASGGSQRAPSWLEAYIDLVERYPTHARPSTLLQSSHYAAMLASMRKWSPRGREIEAARIRRRLLELNPAWARTLHATQLPLFASFVCHGRPDLGATSLMNSLPAADLRAMALLNRALALVPKTCVVHVPALLDVAGNVISRRVLVAQAAKPVRVPSEAQPSGNAVEDAVNKGICTGLQRVSGRQVAAVAAAVPFGRWFVQRLRARGGGGLFLSMVSASAWTACPRALNWALGEAGYRLG